MILSWIFCMMRLFSIDLFLQFIENNNPKFLEFYIFFHLKIFIYVFFSPIFQPIQKYLISPFFVTAFFQDNIFPYFARLPFFRWSFFTNLNYFCTVIDVYQSYGGPLRAMEPRLRALSNQLGDSFLHLAIVSDYLMNC